MKKLLFPLILLFAAPFASAELESYLPKLPLQHIYQKNYRKLGLEGYIYCGPAAVTESLAFLKWHRQPNFPLLKWNDDVQAPNPLNDDYLYSQARDMASIIKTSIFAIPGFEQYFTDPAEIVRGLRQYFKDSGYSSPWVYARGFRAFDAPEGLSVEDMRKPVTLSEIQEHIRKGFGVILLVGYYYPIWSSQHRFGGHFVTAFGYDGPADFIVTDSLFTADQQPRKMRFVPLAKKEGLTYPDHVTHQLEGENSTLLDTAIFFIPEEKN